MRKGQAEIMGLLIIVIMISIIMLFALKYILVEPENFKQDYIYTDLSSSMVGALLNIHSDCTEDTLLGKVIIDCSKYPPTGSTDFICNNGMNSCDYANMVIGDILTETLDKWDKPYEFQVRAPTSNKPIAKLGFNNTNDIGEPTAFSQILPIDTSGSTIQILLCIGGLCPPLG